MGFTPVNFNVIKIQLWILIEILYNSKHTYLDVIKIIDTYFQKYI